MKVELALAVIALCCLLDLTRSIPDEPVEFLRQFGFLPENDPDQGSLMMPGAMTAAISEYQRRSALPITGELDNATRGEMAKPRCGMADSGSMSFSTRKKRYVKGNPWRHSTLTYRITNYGKQRLGLSNTDIDREIQRAFKIWSDVTNMNFSQVNKYDRNADIEIFFRANKHGDGTGFDGPGGVLAHAFYPQNGDAHFDDDEDYTMNTYHGTDLYQVAAHEFGHSLGLSHSSVRGALMFPTYTGYIPNFQLPLDDRRQIQRIYGVRGAVTPPPRTMTTTRHPARPTPPPSGKPSHCVNSKVDGITTTRDGTTYVFKGEQFWQLSYSQILRRIVSAGPYTIKYHFRGLEGNIDAVMTYRYVTYFFKDSRVWQFYNNRVHRSVNRISRKFPGLPSDIDAAFVWSGNNQRYFIKGSQYYRIRYTAVDSGYPRSLRAWSPRLDRVDGAFEWMNGKTYFFVDNDYYRYNDHFYDIDSGYPANTGRVWLGCIDNLLSGNLIQGDTDRNNGTVSDDNNKHLAEQSYILERNNDLRGTASTSSLSSPVLAISCIAVAPLVKRLTQF